jgi:hypothetical protein
VKSNRLAGIESKLAKMAAAMKSGVAAVAKLAYGNVPNQPGIVSCICGVSASAGNIGSVSIISKISYLSIESGNQTKISYGESNTKASAMWRRKAERNSSAAYGSVA